MTSAATKTLTPKQQRFVDEYPIDLNATQAYIRAGYSANGADKLASRLMGHDGVRAAIQQALEKRSERTGVTADRVIHRLAATAFADPRDVVTWDRSGVTLRNSTELTPEQAGTVAEIVSRVTKEGETVTVKLRDPMPALALLAKHTGVIADGSTLNVGGDHREIHVHLDGGPRDQKDEEPA